MGLHWTLPDFWDLWKSASIALTGLFGVLGLLTNYKDKDTGRLTGWGRLNLAGILLSATMGILSQWAEIQGKARTAAEAAVKAQAAADLANKTAAEASTAAQNTEQLIGDVLDVSRRTQDIAGATERSVASSQVAARESERAATATLGIAKGTAAAVRAGERTILNSQAAARESERAATATLGIAQGTSAAVTASQASLDRVERLLSPFASPVLELTVRFDCAAHADACDKRGPRVGSLAYASIGPGVARLFGTRLVGGDIDYFGKATSTPFGAGGTGGRTYLINVPLQVDVNRDNVTSFLDLPGRTLSMVLSGVELAPANVRSIVVRAGNGQHVIIPVGRTRPLAGLSRGFGFSYVFPPGQDPRYRGGRTARQP